MATLNGQTFTCLVSHTFFEIFEYVHMAEAKGEKERREMARLETYCIGLAHPSHMTENRRLLEMFHALLHQVVRPSCHGTKRRKRDLPT